jgi:hypothetical protein
MKRFSMVAYTGTPIKSYFWGELYIDIQGISALSRLPALREHIRDRAVGVVDHLSKSGQLLAQGYFLDTPDATECKSLMAQGYPWQASVGIFPETVEELKKGEQALVNGAKVEGPAAIFRTSHLGEISFVSLGADNQTSISVAASAQAARSEWDQSQELRTSFNHNFAAYAAFKRAEQAGLVTIVTGKTVKG